LPFGQRQRASRRLSKHPHQQTGNNQARTREEDTRLERPGTINGAVNLLESITSIFQPLPSGPGQKSRKTLP
jgi:hypothetical protein